MHHLPQRGTKQKIVNGRKRWVYFTSLSFIPRTALGITLCVFPRIQKLAKDFHFQLSLSKRFTLEQQLLDPSRQSKGWLKNSRTSFFTAADNSSFADLFGNLATSTPNKGNLQGGFNPHNGNNYSQTTTQSKNSFENFQVRFILMISLVDVSFTMIFLYVFNIFSSRTVHFNATWVTTATSRLPQHRARRDHRKLSWTLRLTG